MKVLPIKNHIPSFKSIKKQNNTLDNPLDKIPPKAERLYYNLMKEGLSSFQAVELINSDENFRNGFLKLIDSGVDVFISFKIIKLNGKEKELYEKFIDDGISPKTAYNLTLYNGSNQEKYDFMQSLAKKGIINDSWAPNSYVVALCEKDTYDEYFKNNPVMDEFFSKYKTTLGDFVYLFDLAKQENKEEFEEFQKFIKKDRVIENLISTNGIEKTFKNRNNLDYSKAFNLADKDYSFTILELQNNAGYELRMRKENRDEDFRVIKIITLNDKGETTKSTTEIPDNSSQIARKFQNNNLFIAKKSCQGANVISQLELYNLNDENSAYAIYSKESPKLMRVYETTKYLLKNYPQNINIINAIENGELKGGERLSGVEKTSDDEKKFSSDFERNGYYIKRRYSQKTAQDETPTFKSYELNILDENNNSVIETNTTWQKISDYEAITTLNDKFYNVKVDPNKMKIKIQDDKGKKTTIDIDEKIVPLKYYPEKLKNGVYDAFGDEEHLKKAFMKFLATVPADQLLIFDKLIDEVIPVAPDTASGIMVSEFCTYLEIELEISTLLHELGHGIDYNSNKGIKSLGEISSNEELIKIYNEEMEKFKKDYPEIMQTVFEYLSSTGGGRTSNDFITSTGLGEFVADVNSLISGLGNDSKYTITRCEYIMRYFPKTFVKAYSLIEKAKKDEKLV